MYKNLLATPTGQFVHSRVLSTVTRMIQLSDHGHPALVALNDELPANLANRFKRLAGHLVRRIMREHGYALIPGRRCPFPGRSLFKTAACYRAIREYQRMTDERIIARRVTLDEFCDYMGGLEYIKGKILTGSGIELLVGVKEFPESIRALEEREREYSKSCSSP